MVLTESEDQWEQVIEATKLIIQKCELVPLHYTQRKSRNGWPERLDRDEDTQKTLVRSI